MTERKRNQKQSEPEVKIFTVPFTLKEINETISTNTLFKPFQEQIINQALKFHSQGNISEAANYYQHIIDQGLKDHRVFSNYGIIFKNIVKLKEAELSIRKAIELNPHFADAHYNLGNILRDLGKLKKAELSYCKAIELKPDFTEAYSNLGTILKDLGKAKEAYTYFEKCLELDPNDLAYNML